MKKQRKMKFLAATAAVCCAGVTGVVLADEIPFWKTGTSEPTRAPAAQAASANAAPLDSRTAQSASSAPVAFNSSGECGTAVLVR